MKIITSMSRVRFEELRSGILDGSLAQRLNEMVGREDKLTRKQRIELRQTTAIINLVESNPDLIHWLINTDWRELRLVRKGDTVQIVVKHGKQSIVPPLMYGGVWADTGALRRG